MIGWQIKHQKAAEGNEQAGHDNLLSAVRPRKADKNVGDILRQPDPHTVIPERPRLAVITYTVEAGDTIESIAEQFGLEPTTIMWANPAVEDAPDLLRIGQQITILPIDGVYHQVEEEDTLASVAEAYEVEPDAMVSCGYNDLAWGRELKAGNYLIVPGGNEKACPRPPI